MDITLLCIGDVVGRPGRFIVAHGVPQLVKQHGIDCVIVNVENAAAGSGLTANLYEKFLRYGVDVMNLGDHTYRKADILPTLENSERIVRPANFPEAAVGRGCTIFETAAGAKVAVIQLIGRLFVRTVADCPFQAVDRILARLPSDVKIVVVDMHAEATSEKVAMGWHLDGRVSVLFGTHTHIPTADERVLEKGTAYITDLGMTGPYDSVLGRRKDRVLRALTTGMPCPFDVATEDPWLCGILVKVDSDTGRASHIERVRLDTSNLNAPINGATPDDD